METGKQCDQTCEKMTVCGECGQTGGPVLIKVLLIDDRRLELYWDRQVRRADEEAHFTVCFQDSPLELVHWTEDRSWAYGTVYQKESMRTTLCLEKPVDTDRARELTVRVSERVTDLMDIPADSGRIYTVRYKPYYTQRVTASCGIPVKAGRTVSPDALRLASSILDLMLGKLPQIAAEMVRRGAEVAVYGLKENAYDLPEHRQGYLLAVRHVEGFGGGVEEPICTVSEANLIRLRSGRYATGYPNEMILVHEFGHGIHLIGLEGYKDRDSRLLEQLEKAYENARAAGLWPDTYAISNCEEYFATLSTVWFNVMQEGVDGKWDGIRGPVNTREELRRYDPEGYELMEALYFPETLPAPWDACEDQYNEDGLQP